MVTFQNLRNLGRKVSISIFKTAWLLCNRNNIEIVPHYKRTPVFVKIEAK